MAAALRASVPCSSGRTSRRTSAPVGRRTTSKGEAITDLASVRASRVSGRALARSASAASISANVATSARLGKVLGANDTQERPRARLPLRRHEGLPLVGPSADLRALPRSSSFRRGKAKLRGHQQVSRPDGQYFLQSLIGLDSGRSSSAAQLRRRRPSCAPRRTATATVSCLGSRRCRTSPSSGGPHRSSLVADCSSRSREADLPAEARLSFLSGAGLLFTDANEGEVPRSDRAGPYSSCSSRASASSSSRSGRSRHPGQIYSAQLGAPVRRALRVHAERRRGLRATVATYCRASASTTSRRC